jgi:butyrate kinase
MSETFRILVINPGSTSTKISVFENEREVWGKNLKHTAEELAVFDRIINQYNFRKDVILGELEDAGFRVKDFSCVVGRGGVLMPIEGGTYRVTKKLLDDLRAEVQGTHVSNLGAPIAIELASVAGCEAFIVDPVVVDEMEPPARYSGHPLIRRRSIFHALNQRAVARKACQETGREYSESNLIVAHLGGGISVGAHSRGRVIDVNNGLNGDGPFTPERTGGLPSADLAALCFSGDYTHEQVKKMIKGEGGMVAYLGTNDMVEVEEAIAAGNDEWREVYYAMAYQIAKEIGGLSAVLSGDVDLIVISGGVAYDEKFTGWIRERIGFIAPVMVYPGEMEMEALARGGLRVLSGLEQAKTYKG